MLDSDQREDRGLGSGQLPGPPGCESARLTWLELQGQQSWALRPVSRVQGARERVSPDPHCPVIFTRRAMSQRDTEDTFKAATREEQGGPVTAGRKVSAAVWFIITPVRNGTGSRLGTSLEELS